MPLTGSIDLLGYHRPTGGWLLCGWIAVAPALARGLPLASSETAAGRTLVALFDRNDMEQRGTGFLLFMDSPPPRRREIRLSFGRQTCALSVLPAARELAGIALTDQCRLLLNSAFAGQMEPLATLLAMRDFTGRTDFAAVGEDILAGVDDLIPCAPAGAVLIFWLLAHAGGIRSITLCAGQARWPLPPSARVAVERPDVLDTSGRARGFEDPRCGFVAFVPGVVSTSDAFLAIEAHHGGLAYVAVPPRRLHGLPAIRRTLEMVELATPDCRIALDVLAPAINLLQAERRAMPATVETAAFGTPAAPALYSLVIPLHRRIDYLEYQIALFSAEPGAAEWDVVYVLDDPPRRREALALAESVFARFALPFRLLLLGENSGFAAASNAGLAAARGAFVTFLNSDVFPETPGFMARLASTLEHDPALGAVGGLLLFEDGSVQHEGMLMQATPTLGGLRFPVHHRKGRRPAPPAGVQRWPAITGACLMMRRELALALRGFDEDFILGDFEDCDLCDRIRAQGLAVAVDHGARLLHLERQSQAAPSNPWRQNLTIYNAHLYETKQPTQAPPRP